MSNFQDLEMHYWTKFSEWGIEFTISSSGNIRGADNEDLWHLEDCLEEWKVLFDLVELLLDLDEEQVKTL